MLLKSGSLNTWTAQWVATSLPKGKYLIGVQAVDDNTMVDDGVTPTGIDNRTFSYVTGDASNQIYINGSGWEINPADFPSHSPSMSPVTTENWYGNPSVTGVQTALMGVALNNCGLAPTLTKTSSADSVVASGTVDFTLTINNLLTTSMTLNQIIDTLPSGFSYLAGYTSGTGVLAGAGEPSSGGQTPTWDFSSLSIPAGGSGTLTFRATVSSISGNYTNSASATTSFGTLSSNPVAVAVDAARISLTKTPNIYSINPDGTTQLIYTLNYSNDSTVSVTNASIIDILPGGVTYFACSGGSSCGYSSGTVTWTIGTLTGGATGSATRCNRQHRLQHVVSDEQRNAQRHSSRRKPSVQGRLQHYLCERPDSCVHAHQDC